MSANFDEPMDFFKRGLEVARRYKMTDEISQALLGLGLMALLRGEYDKAWDNLQESLDICNQEEIYWTKANVLNFMAWIDNAQGKRTRAKALSEEALAIQRGLGDSNGMASTLNTLGVIHSNLGQYADAENAYAESLALCRQSGQRLGAGAALTGLFGASYRQGHYDKARAYAEESLTVNTDIGNRLGTAIAHHNLGFLAAKAGNHVEAVEYFQKTLDAYQAIEADIVRLNNSRRYLADSLIAMGEFESAREQLQLALTTITNEMADDQILELLLTCAILFGKSSEKGLSGELLTFVQDHEAATPVLNERIAASMSVLPKPAGQLSIETLDMAVERVLDKLT
jgi:tetratricopeptide (TPR) repeat protein